MKLKKEALLQPLVSVPPYKGDQIEDKQKWLEKEEKNKKQVKIISSFIDELEKIFKK